ncbi:flagellar hook-associated protein 2 [Paraburkholderia fungorum]|uniref:Flagellar hook-associated protein 2 n=1 Tax=Paraburkholderia fungorum TaxID=134537 RepID=A0A1H0YM46_9BURK|nr:flagellar filament capping protein FliD [Paraburkholderia fungorum]SDQ16239.1 flagellar hook-associated protein 2 [Paraburkholderia fungorum]
MSTISTSASTSSAAAAAAQAAAAAALQQASQSIISGSTGSSLDVSSLVTALVNSKIAGQTATLTAKATTDNTQLSAIGQLSASLSSLQVGLAPLFNGSLQTAFTATASGTGLTATAASGAVAGTYSVKTTQIAQGQSITSGAFTSAQTASMGTGTLNIMVGSSSMTLAVNSTNNTLSGIAAAINNSSTNPGVAATVVNGADGAHLVLSSTTTGAANTINVNVTGASTGAALSSLSVQSVTGNDSDTSTFASAADGTTTSIGASTLATGSTWTQSSAAQDAVFSLNGTIATSSTNAVTSALDGVTMNLASASAGTTQTLTVAADTATQVTDIENFVSQYNAVVSTMTSLTSFDSSAAAGSQGGPLLGDSMLDAIQNGLGNIVSSGIKGAAAGTTLASLGITLNSDGTMSVDTTALTAAVQYNPNQVAAVFNTSTGIAAQLNTTISAYTTTGGIIDVRTDAITTDLDSIKDQSNTLTAYQAQLTSQYNNEFTALNTLMATTTSNSNYLTQLFGGTNSSGSMSDNKA